MKIDNKTISHDKQNSGVKLEISIESHSRIQSHGCKSEYEKTYLHFVCIKLILMVSEA